MKKLIALLCCAVMPAIGMAQDFPSRAIKLVVGFPPGGSNDVVARIIAPKMSEILKQPVVVENRSAPNSACSPSVTR